MVARGPHSIQLTKVRGHAKREHTGEDPELCRHKEGTDKADYLAGEARRNLHGDLLMYMSDFSADRYHAYTHFLFCIHQFITSTHLAGQQIHKAIARTNGRKLLMRVTPPPYPRDADGNRGKFKLIPQPGLLDDYPADTCYAIKRICSDPTSHHVHSHTGDTARHNMV